ncbi:FAD binding domain-containing protein [Mariannaea sp. PMI_226]|nr:FAD binding domain-containing protein [Mariannaea sp. PMI_226]
MAREAATSTTSTESAAQRPFRVIIAGAGAGGLAFSHALQRAGIDHVVLEKGVVAPDWGASISLWGNGARILSQIGCMDALEAKVPALRALHVRGADGKVFSEEPFFDMMLERNGFECLTMERKDFLKIIHEKLPDKSYVKTEKRVVDVIEREDGLTVMLQDGTQEEGDILIGCDGVHSTVRDLMWRNANLAQPNCITAQEKRSRVTSYKSLVGVSKTVPGLGSRCMHWVCHRGLSFLILVQADKTYFFVNWKLPQELRWPTKPRWSNEEAERAAASVAELPISDSTVFGELWKHRIRAHLIGLEEGIFEHWHHGRIALAGDSVHKMTPNFALGAMCALESSVVLINEIHQMNNNLKPGERPSKATISSAFQRYQEERMPRIRAAFDMTALLTRMHAYDGLYHWFAMRCVFPITGMAPYADLLGDLCSGAPKIKFLPVKYTKPATIKWKDEPDHVPAKLDSKDPAKYLRHLLAETASLLSLVIFIFFFFGSAVDRSLSVSGPFESISSDLLVRPQAGEPANTIYEK